MALEKELKYFEDHRKEFLEKHEGNLAVIKETETGIDVLGFFADGAAAYEAGFKKYGNVSFLIKEVRKEEAVTFSPSLTYGLIHAHL